MARRLVSTVVRMRGGATLGFGARVRIYDDEALTTLSTIYRRSTGVGTQPNPLLPNAGAQTALTVNAGAGDATITVAATAGFQVGDLIPLRDPTNTRYRVITNINTGTGVITLDSVLGVAFATTDTMVGAPEMRGHIWGWLETVVDPFAEIEDIASGRRSPPLQIPLGVPAAVVSFAEEGGVLGQFSVVNFIGTAITAADVGAGQLDVTVSAPTQASFDDHNARHEPGGADPMAVDAAAGTGSLRTIGTGALQAAAGQHGAGSHDGTVADSLDLQVFSAGGTWTKPTSGTPKVVEVRVRAAGGGGGGGGIASGTSPGGGGGGGAFLIRRFDPSALAATETVTIGAGGTAGVSNGAGGGGGTTSFGSHVSVAGGAGGAAPASGTGGGGGGTAGAGSGASGGEPRITGLASTPTNTNAGMGATGGNQNAVGGNAEFGGGGGGGAGLDAIGKAGGSSLHAGGAGGGGGGRSAVPTIFAGGAGGAYNSYAVGGGGAGGTNAGGNPGTAGTSRLGTGKAGDGGGGGGGGGGVGGAGGAGGAPSGGGGGGGAGSGTGGAGGGGGGGEVIVITYF